MGSLLPPAAPAQCSDCCTYKLEIRSLKKEVAALLIEKDEALVKAKKYKDKYKSLKINQRAPEQEEIIKIGCINIPKEQYVRVRTQNFSRYTADLLEVIVGRETLAKSSIKHMKSSEKKALDAELIKTIISHVVIKYNVSSDQVRTAIRMKLNSAHKSVNYCIT